MPFSNASRPLRVISVFFFFFFFRIFVKWLIRILRPVQMVPNTSFHTAIVFCYELTFHKMMRWLGHPQEQRDEHDTRRQKNPTVDLQGQIGSCYTTNCNPKRCTNHSQCHKSTSNLGSSHFAYVQGIGAVGDADIDTRAETSNVEHPGVLRQYHNDPAGYHGQERQQHGAFASEVASAKAPHKGAREATKVEQGGDPGSFICCDAEGRIWGCEASRVRRGPAHGYADLHHYHRDWEDVGQN